MEKLTVWILEELGRRDWKPADLARKAGMSTGTLSNILNGNRGPGPEACVAIARALGERPEKVFRLAGLLPSEPEPAQDEDKLLDVYRQLSHQEQAFLLRFLGNPQFQQSHQAVPVTSITLPDLPSLDIEPIIEVINRLDILERRLVYDYACWRLAEQEQRRNSSDRRQKSKEAREAEIKQVIEHLDLLITVEETDPLQWKWAIARLQRMIREKQAVADQEVPADST